ncbi:MAG TPA: SDR family oxidoreductase [Pyrinomonadaceae bacterium]|nr:SDR family oxidoreductase [Pyrinomonadaceae bacterium]
MKTNKPVILITGASSGIGRACADRLSEKGCNVYRAARSFASRDSDASTRIHLDVDDDDSVNDCVGRVAEREGRIDVVVNCAGYGLAGPFEEASIVEIKAQFETNLFGVIRVCQAALPLMRRQRGGLIVNISSIGGLISLPFQGFYSASKFALEAATEALRMEVAPFGIRVVLVEPGDFNTPFTAHRRRAAKAAESVVYRERFEKALAVMEGDERSGRSPQAVARLLERIIEERSPSCRYVIGTLSERTAIILRMLLPCKLYERMIAKHYRSSL